MKRFLPCLLLSLVVLVAAPLASANKNRMAEQVTCNGKTYTVVGNERSNFNGAQLFVGIGPVKVISVTATTTGGQVLFSFQSNFPKPPNLSCQATETDPDTGQTINFTAEVYAKRS